MDKFINQAFLFIFYAKLVATRHNIHDTQNNKKITNIFKMFTNCNNT
ncbi:hypothetical protein HMPREF0424_0846 [Gardnerella vaginalis 409-05]|nr:hypothetical protein HMPREF0424_0846 [Gardnerella vaginalis 409-05]